MIKIRLVYNRDKWDYMLFIEGKRITDLTEVHMLDAENKNF